MMNDNPPDHGDTLDELASEYVDGLADGLLDAEQRRAVENDPRLVERVASFSALRSSLGSFDVDDPDDADGFDGSDDVSLAAERQTAAAMAAFDDIHLSAARSGDHHTAPLNAPISISARRFQRSQRSRRVYAGLALAAMLALAIVGVRSLSTSESKSASKAAPPSGALLPAAASATTRDTAKVTVSAGGDSGGAAEPGEDTVIGAATTSAAIPVLANTADLAVYVDNRVGPAPPSKQTTASTTTLPRAASATTSAIAAASVSTTGAAATTAAAGGAATTAAAATAAAATASGSLGPAVADATGSTPSAIPCDATPGAVSLGRVTWQGQPATVFVHIDTTGQRLATVYDMSCAVLVTATV